MKLSNPLGTLRKLFGKTIELGYAGTTRKFKLEKIEKTNSSNVLLTGTKFTDTSAEPRAYRLDRVESIKLI